MPKTSRSTTPEAVKNAAIVRRLSRTLRLRAALVMSDAIDECPVRFNGKGTTSFLLRLKIHAGFKKDVAPAAVAGALFVAGARLKRRYFIDPLDSVVLSQRWRSIPYRQMAP